MKFYKVVCVLLLAMFSVSALAAPTPQQAFDDAYWAHQPPAVRVLRGDPNDFGKVVELANQGFLLDTTIMLAGWDPYVTMMLRKAQGETWTPSALMHPLGCVVDGCFALPGLGTIGAQRTYPKSPIPAGGLKVSTDLADFPVYVAPEPEH